MRPPDPDPLAHVMRRQTDPLVPQSEGVRFGLVADVPGRVLIRHHRGGPSVTASAARGFVPRRHTGARGQWTMSKRSPIRLQCSGGGW